MKKREHLPFMGVGPLIVGFQVGVTAVLKMTEEKWLKALYGDEYISYCRRVNRSIPWFSKKV